MGSLDYTAAAGFLLSFVITETYRSQLKHLNLKSRLPDATEDDVSLVPEALLGLT